MKIKKLVDYNTSYTKTHAHTHARMHAHTHTHHTRIQLSLIPFLISKIH